MKRNQLYGELFSAREHLWVAVANERNNGEPVYACMRSGRPMTGRYCGTYAQNLRRLVQKCRKPRRVDSSAEVMLGHLLCNLEWEYRKLVAYDELVADWNRNNDGKYGAVEYRSRMPEWSGGELQKCIDLPLAEKIRRCNDALDSFDAYFAQVA